LIVVICVVALILVGGGIALVVADPFDWFSGAPSVTEGLPGDGVPSLTEEPSGNTTGVAATVGDTDLLETDVTLRVESFRTDPISGDSLDDSTWAQVLRDAGYTPASLREYIIRYQFAYSILILQRAQEAGIVPDAAAVDRSIADTKSSVESLGDTWEEYLLSVVYANEAALRQDYEAQDVIDALLDAELGSDTSNQSRTAAEQEYLEALAYSSEIIVNPMPKGLSYDVDLSLADAGGESASPESPATPTKWDAPEPTFAKNGLGISDVAVGTGPAAGSGDKLVVHYSLYLEDGTLLESSVTSSAPFEFTLGEGHVIEGWDLGLVGMKVGGKRELTIPASLAYGSAGSGSVPPDATLLFDIELLAIE
jgi:FKBP-type peptidyl-prolyl cis-trans isomerase